ncbi:MAG TPA: hypothetical protein VFX30_02960 [bacterium]|nr:hypothetical protein [bacterium]
MRRFLAALALASTLTLPASPEIFADAPLPPPELRTFCSRNGFFCAATDPEARLTTVYRRRAGGVQESLWSMPGWFRVAYLSSDGEYLVTGYDGLNLLPLDYKKDEVMLSFYDRGKLIRQVRLNEMIADFSKLEKTASHYQWGKLLGLNADDHLTVELADKRWLLYNVKTGQLIK